MRKQFLLITVFLLLLSVSLSAQLDNRKAWLLAQMPMKSIQKEYPNKTGHIYNSATEQLLSNKDLHPVFYGCFDWHSSVHGHWMLVRILKLFPDHEHWTEITELLNESFREDKIKIEAAYFSNYANAKLFERTYGWAWLLKLDRELMQWNHPKAKAWHQSLQPLTDTIVALWKNYLPKQTYPDRTGVHPNSAFALGFALEWSRAKGDNQFEKAIIEKAVGFYGNEKDTPGYLEPNGSDFFSPALQIASLMSKVYSPEQFGKWYYRFLSKRSYNNLCRIPVVSDLNDYQTVHLVGLSFSKAWCMKEIASALPTNSKKKNHLKITADNLINQAFPLLFQGNYGGDHWLASFALLAMDNNK